MSKRIVRKPHNDKIVEMLEDIACNRDDFDLVKCAAEIREIVKTELQNETRRIVNDKGYLQIGRLMGIGIKLKVVDRITGKRVNYGVQLNNTTLEIEALPNLIVTIEKDKK